jgi:hypothetical protein
MDATHVEVNGREPEIVGRACEGMVAIEHSYAGTLVEPANVVFLRFAGRWHRLYFDYATVFWREDSDGPQGFTAEELEASFRPVDLGGVFGVQDAVLKEVTYVALKSGAAVHLRFTNGKLVRFECKDDVTGYSA